MTTYSESDLATETLRTPGLLGAEETPSAADFVDTEQSNRSVIATMASLGLPIWNGSAIAVPEEYFVELAVRCSLPIQMKNGLIDAQTYLGLIDESERRLTVMAAPKGAYPSTVRTNESTGRYRGYDWRTGQ